MANIAVKNKYKVLVIGLDGGTFNIINPLVEKGHLPNIAKMMDEGCFGILNSTIPPISPSSWASFMTGKNPGKHGIYDFVVYDKGGHRTHVTDSRDIKSKTIWKLLSEKGRRVIVINVPMTYPPEEVNGILIPHTLVPPEGHYTYPPSLTEELRQKGYVINARWTIRTKGDRSFLDPVMTMIERRIQVAEDLMTRNEWDLFVLVFVAPDRLQHLLWNHKTDIEQCYIAIDRGIGKLCSLIRNPCVKIIMSDHGHTDAPKTFYVDQWLANVEADRRRLTQAGRTDLSHFYFAAAAKIRAKVGRNLPPFLKKMVRSALSQANLITQGKLTAPLRRRNPYSGRPYGICIERGGSPRIKMSNETEEYERILSHIIEELTKLRDPDTGDIVIEKIYRREDIFVGEFAHNAPDIIFLTKDMYNALASEPEVGSYVIGRSEIDNSHHHPDGVFIVSGTGIGKTGNSLERIDMVDMAPTILHILDLPIPEDMDGKVVRKIFRRDSQLWKKNEVYQSPSISSEGEKQKPICENDQEAIKDQLRALGYID